MVIICPESGCLGYHLHLLNSKHYNTEKEIFSSEKYFPFSDNFLILSIEKFVYIMKGVLLFFLPNNYFLVFTLL